MNGTEGEKPDSCKLTLEWDLAEDKLINLKYKILYETLKKCEWNRTWTAVILGISLRTVRNWIREMRVQGYKIPYSFLHKSKDDKI